jgi:hypothetical protein
MDNVTEPAGKYAVALFFTASSVILFSAFKIGNSATSPEFNHGIFQFQKRSFSVDGVPPRTVSQTFPTTSTSQPTGISRLRVGL